jgi:CubicO group peptidase (beta-lactamase class C family)
MTPDGTTLVRRFFFRMARHMKRSVFLVLTCAALTFVAPRAQTATVQTALAELDAQLPADFAKDGAGGASIAVITGENAIWIRHYGFADAEARRAPTNDTAYRIGSITKQFTALALLRQVEAGRMTLSDPAEKFVPELKSVRGRKPDWGAPTLLQLATMNSGLAREPAGSCTDHSSGSNAEWQKKVLACLPHTSFASEPGTEHLYSNIGYATLGLAIERAGGSPFMQQVTDGVITPLAMTRTGWEAAGLIATDLAHGYTRRGATPDRTAPDRELAGRGYRVPNGALFSTVNDLARFVRWELGHLRAPVIAQKTQEDNYGRVYASNNTLTGGYGIGFQVIRRPDGSALGHGGSTAGYRASALFNRQLDIGVIVLRNAEGGSFDAGSVAARIFDRIAAAKRAAREAR